MTPELKALSERLEEVEKQIAHLAALLTEQSDTSRTIVARRFVVVDEKEQRRATLESTRAGPYLGLFDANQNVRAGLGVTAATAPRHEGPWLQLFGEKGHVVAEVREYQDGPRVALFDANGTTRISLNLSPNGSFAYLFGPSGKEHLRLELFSSGQVSGHARRRRGTKGASCGRGNNGSNPSLYDKQQCVLVCAMIGPL